MSDYAIVMIQEDRRKVYGPLRYEHAATLQHELQAIVPDPYGIYLLELADPTQEYPWMEET